MSDEIFSPSERARQKAESRARDQRVLEEGRISPEEMQRRNGHSDLFRGAKISGRPKEPFKL